MSKARTKHQYKAALFFAVYKSLFRPVSIYLLKHMERSGIIHLSNSVSLRRAVVGDGKERRNSIFTLYIFTLFDFFPQ